MHHQLQKAAITAQQPRV